MAKNTKTETLRSLVEAEAKERARARELEASAEAAAAHVNQARAQLVEAHAAVDARAIRAAEKNHEAALKQAENASVQAEAALLRIDRASRERHGYVTANARELIAELQPQAREIVERLQSSAHQLVTADRAWGNLAQEVNHLLAEIPGASPITDAPSTHVLAEVARDIRHALANEATVEPPTPHFDGLKHREAEQRTVTEIKRERQAA